MPITPTYPGVYIEEVPSGVRTVSGVATSICAFVGATTKGPVNDPVVVFNYGEFERTFGSLSLSSPLSYSVRDFFLNGGSQAIIVRVVNDGSDGDVAASTARFDLINDGSPELLLMSFEASNPGAWANVYRLEVDVPAHGGSLAPTNPTAYAAAVDVASGLDGVEVTDLFHLRVLNADGVVLESFTNLTMVDGPRRVDNVLRNASRLVRYVGDPSASGELPSAALTTPIYLSSPGVDGDPPRPGHLYSDTSTKEGIHALERADLFNLLVIPPLQLSSSGDIPADVWTQAASYCLQRRAMLLVDPPTSTSFTLSDAQAPTSASSSPLTGISGDVEKNTAFYFPRLIQPNPLRDGQLEEFAPAGAVAGIFSRTDSNRGVWKAPAGIEAGLTGVPKLAIKLTDGENGLLNQIGVNCLRSFPAPGRVVWGARTRKGSDALSSEWKYVPVRRTALYIEESLFRGLQWVVFEPNDEPLWAQIRLNVGSFMNRLFRQGAFQGTKPKDAYLVKCDAETTTQDDIDRGIVNIVVGFAPLKPAEFVVLKLQQLAGQSAA